jgi:hypothetical protein
LNCTVAEIPERQRRGLKFPGNGFLTLKPQKQLTNRRRGEQTKKYSLCGPSGAKTALIFLDLTGEDAKIPAL